MYLIVEITKIVDKNKRINKQCNHINLQNILSSLKEKNFNIYCAV